ncbi:MAG: T9SS type A sorting domain-containing protein [Bacteroidetes bacterium]|nr:T9SS type A sorting domain-containing protein [Bacteroidota bacterium]
MKTNKYLLVVLFLLVLNELYAQPYYDWYQLNIPTNNNLLFAKQIADGSEFILGKNGTILYKSFNTALWVSQNSTTTSDLNSFAVNATTTLWICGNNGVILKSTNIGTNWIAVNSTTTSNLKTILRINNVTIAALGVNGAYVQSSDAGVTWSVKPNFTNQTLNCSATGGAVYYVCGNAGVIFKTTDFGSTWNNVSIGSTNLNSINFYDSNTGWITGDNGLIALTTNGGSSWVQQNSNVTTKLNSVSISSFPSAFISGNGGLVLKTSNMGTNWITQNSFTSQNLNAVAFSAEIGYACGDNGTAFVRRIDTTYTFNTSLTYNNFAEYFNDRLVINKNSSINGRGLEWPRGAGRFLSDAFGLNITAKVNGVLRTATTFQKSEFAPGYVQNGNYTFDSRFRIYKVKENDLPSSYNWQKWGEAVPFGAPYVDINQNGIYEPLIDKPGVKDAGETNFICVTDASDTAHHLSNGYGAGTLPLGAEIHFTIWAAHFIQDTATLHFVDDAVFMKYEIFNKSNTPWTGAYFSFLNDGYLGNETDDYIGSDSVRKIAYYYNSTNTDGTGAPGEYGAAPPAYGIAMYKGAFLNSNPTVDLGMTSMGYFYGTTGCTSDNMTSDELYNMAKGFKKDGTPWINILNNQPTKFNYTGDPQTGIGWTEFNGRVLNCGGSTTGPTEVPSTPSQRNIIFSTGSDNLTMNPGDKQVIVLMQAVQRGSYNKNSVTKLKDFVQTVKDMYYIPRFSVNLQTINTFTPEKFSLYQNFPNPFNPDTQIKFDISKTGFVSLIVFDINGKELNNLVNQNLAEGTYSYKYDASGLPSGVYFYQIKTSSFTQTKKMILLK